MRCPNCHDEYEAGTLACAECDVPLVPDGVEVPAATAPVDARLGRFHPAVADRISELLFRRGIEHDLVVEAEGVRILVQPDQRDDLRAELTLTWGDVVRRLPDQQASEVLSAGGSNPGWYDAPRGGHVDRQGRLVVDLDDGTDDDARVIGPAMLTAGAILAVVGFYVLDTAAVTAAGIALAVAGLLLPR